MERYKIDLTGKNIVITGSAGAICSSFARELANVGARVALLDINLEKAEALAEDIRKSGAFALAYYANVLDKACLDECAKQVAEDFGSVDMLINGAGGNHPSATTDKEYFFEGDDLDPSLKTFFSLNDDAIRKVFDLNFTSILLATQAFGKYLVKSHGSIINISSMNSFRPLTKIPAYSAAKASVSNFTEWLAVHFAPVGIRVNAIAPGFFVGNQNRGLLFTPEGELTPRSHKIISHTPLGRFGELDELTGTLLWLADDAFSGFVTGIVVPVDGGFSAYSGV